MAHTRLRHSLWPIAILLLAFALRIIFIDHIPAGLSHDEAYNGVTAMQVLAGERAIFFEINKGIEPLIIYLEALAFYAFGIGPVPMRLVNVMCGLLTVALIYPLAARLFNRRVALLAMAGLAISFWPIFVSRLTLRAVTLPPLLILTLYFLWRGLTQNPEVRHKPTHEVQVLTWFALSGLAAGASMYTYLSSRFVPLLIGAVFGYQLIRRQLKPRYWVGLLILCLIWTALFAPLASYYLEHADSFTERANQVSTLPYLLNGDPGPMVRNTLLTLGMFTFHGDETDRYNLDGRPVFDWINGLLFYLGLGIAWLRLRRQPKLAGPAALLLLWFFFMLLPDFITDDSPHFLRTIGAMPVVFLLWAVGVESVWQRVKAWTTSYASFFIPILLLFTSLHTIYDYFGRWATAPEARYIYGADIAEVADYVQATREEGLVAISAEYYRDLDPFRLLLHLHGQPPFVIWFDGRQTLAFPPVESGLSPRYIFPASAPPAEVWLPFLQPSPAESGQAYTVYRLPDLAALQQARTATFSSASTLAVNINDDLVLSAYEMLGTVVSGGKFQLLLAWQALRSLPPGTDYTFLVRLRDRQGHVWAEADGNGYPAGDWQPGVQGLQLLTIRLPGDLPPQTYELTVEVVDRQRSQSLPTPTGETVISLTTLAGQLAKTPRVIDPEKLPNPIPVSQTEPDSPAISLRGYKVENQIVGTNEEMALTLHWQVLKSPQQNYWLEFSLLERDEADTSKMVYRWPPFEPVSGEWPTSQWPAGYWVQDKLTLPVQPDMPAGQFELHGRWLDLTTGQPPLTAAGEPFPDFELGSVTIEIGP